MRASAVLARMQASRAVVVLLWAGAAAALALSWHGWLTDLTYPGMPWQDPHSMADFRDTVWTPGRWLLAGGNPYDPAPYLAANPGAQELDPYAPAWLLMAIPFALLPFVPAAVAYLALGVVLAVVLLRLLLRSADDRMVPLGTPVGLIWLAVWSPGRYTLQQGGTFLVFVGWVLVMRGLIHRSAPWTAVGLALTLLKPQFGLPLLVVLLAAGQLRAAVTGALVLAVASAPALALCVVAAGGPAEFVGSIARLLSYASSPDASTGLLSPHNGRIDVAGLLGRGGIVMPGWAQLAVALGATALACVLARRAPAWPATAGIAALTLLGLVHQPYDIVVLLAPVVFALPTVGASIDEWWRNRDDHPPHRDPSRTQLLIWALAVVPVAHLHRVTTLVLPTIGADLIDVAALALCAGVVVAAHLGQERRSAASPS